MSDPTPTPPPLPDGTKRVLTVRIGEDDNVYVTVQGAGSTELIAADLHRAYDLYRARMQAEVVVRTVAHVQAQAEEAMRVQSVLRTVRG